MPADLPEDDLLAKMAGIMEWRPRGSAPFLFIDGGAVMWERGRGLTDSGWKAIVLRLLEEGCIVLPEVIWGGSTRVGVARFATPGKPTGDELMAALVEVCE